VEREVYRNAKLRELYEKQGGPETKAEMVSRLERKLLLGGIQGFFPTPKESADQLVSLVGPIASGELILEPGAGTGSLIDAAFRVQPEALVHYFERNYSLSDFLAAKYGDNPNVYSPGKDFTDFALEHYSPRFEVIVMNPPFESGQDGEHVQRAYELLATGGRLAAIVGAGVQHVEMLGRSPVRCESYWAVRNLTGSSSMNCSRSSLGGSPD
jgi:predicted RNA methylase